jgi:hypothetical protein
MTSFFSSKDRIHIQTVKFQFKQINQKSSRHYRLPAQRQAVVRALPPGQAPAWAVAPALTSR